MTRARARWVTVLGVLLAVAGLVGFWLNKDVERKDLTADQRRLLGIGADDFHVSFVVAGRDINYIVNSAEPVYAQDGTIINWNWRGSKSSYGTLTDTILYVAINGDDISMIAIPRDTLLPGPYMRINSVYHHDGAEGLRREVEAILGVPVDYYVIVKLDIFQNLVDAVGGVTVDVPYPMRYRDNAAGLNINFQPGPQHMDGEDASKFIRFRETLRGDIDRIDNVKRLAYALLERIKQLNVRAVTTVPGLVDTFFKDVETNASLNLLGDLVGRLSHLNLTTTATLPLAGEENLKGLGSVVLYDPAQVNRFMAATFGGQARDFAATPDVTLLVTDRSGVPGLADWYVQRLSALGVPPDSILLRAEEEPDASPTRLLATLKSWEDADYFTEMLNVGKQQIDRFPTYQRQNYQLELVLGSDAEARSARVAPLLASLQQP